MGLFDFFRSKHKDTADTLFQTGFYYFKQCSYDKAKKTFQKLLLINPNHVESLICLGQIFIAESNDKEAIPLLEKATKLGMQDSELYHLLGCSYGSQEKFGKAQEAFKQALEIDPNNELAREALMMCVAKLRYDKLM
jgi:tetratricopeptide (TPR) repeat protein